MIEPIAYILFLCSLVFGVIATGVFRMLAIRVGLVDQPNAIIPQHTRPVAHMGGVGVAAAVCATIGIAWIAGAMVSVEWSSHPGLAGFCLTAFGFAAIGATDDLWRLSARVKLLLQLPVAGVAAWCGVSFSFTGIPLLDAAISAAWIIAVVNAVNVTDVCDGLVSGICVVTFVLWAFFDPPSAPIALTLAGACLGFLCFNFPPAQIFLGDTGSHLLGAGLAALTLMRLEQSHGAAIHALQMSLFVAPFLFETALLIFVRRRKGIPWWRGSPDHFSLRLQAAGLSRSQTDFVAWTATLLCCLAALGLGHGTTLGRVLIVAGVAIGLGLSWRFVLKQKVKGGVSPTGERQSRPLKVLWIHQNLITAHQVGNARPMHVIAGFLNRGWSVEIITTQTGYLDDAPANQTATIERDGNLTLHRVATAGGPKQRYRAAVVFCLRAVMQLRHVGKVDVVYCSTPPSLQILLAVIVSVLRSAPMTLEIRDLWPGFLSRLGIVRSWPVIAALSWLESLGLRFAHACVPVSPAMTDYLKDMGCHPDRMTVIPSGADPALAQPDDQARRDVRVELGLEDKLVVLYAGSFNIPYAIGSLLEAAHESAAGRTDVVWLFAGNGRMRSEVETAAKKSQAIRYVGAIPKQDISRYFAAADVGVVSLASDPMLKVVLPGKLLDYLSAGLPVICNNDGLSGVVVREADAGIVTGEPETRELADAVIDLANRPRRELTAMGARGQRWVLTYLSSNLLSQSIPDPVLDACYVGQRKTKSLSALMAAAGATIDVLTLRERRAVRRMLRTDLSKMADVRLMQWLAADSRRRGVASLVLPSLPKLLSARERVDKPVSQGITFDVPNEPLHPSCEQTF